MEGNTPNADVKNNTISLFNAASADQAAVFFEANTSFSTVEVNNNNFNVGTAAYGIAVRPVPTTSVAQVDGTCNWWGAPNGPGPVGSGAGAQVSPNVDYTPWLTFPALSGSCIGGNVATDKDQCKNDGWMTRSRANDTGFKNQGDCIHYVNTGK